MAHTPRLKVFTPQGEYVASCKRPEEAAVLVAFLGAGARIACGFGKRDTLWTEGVDGDAAESYDAVAERIYEQVPHLFPERASA